MCSSGISAPAIVIALFIIALTATAPGSTVKGASYNYGVMCDACPTGGFSGVSVGTVVHGEAATDNSAVGEVGFKWIRPDTSVASNDLVTTASSCSYFGKYVGNPAGSLTTSPPTKCFHDSFTPDVGGDWGMQATFCRTGSSCTTGMMTEFIAIRAVSLPAGVPEFAGIAFIITAFAPILLLLRRRRLAS